MQSYGTMQGEKHRRTHRKIIGCIIIIFILLAGLYILGVLTSDSPEYQMRANIIQENHILKEQITELEETIEDLEAELKKLEAITTNPVEPETVQQAEGPATPRDEER